MEFDQRLELALARVSTTGIWRNNYAPPIYHCLWFAGVEVPPPHFASFAFNAALSGVWFGACWIVIMWFTCWSRGGVPGLQAAAFATIIGTCFGVVMASYYSISAWRYRIPSWNALARITAT